MSKPEYSQTFVGRDIFATIWAITILSALGSSSKIILPFDKEYISFIELKRNTIHKLLDLIARFTGLSKEVMNLAESESPWSFIPENNYSYYEADAINAELAITSGTKEYIEYNYDDVDTLRLGIEKSLNAQLIKFFDALLQGRFCFSSDKNHPCISLINEIFEEVEILINDCMQLASNSLLQYTFSKWWEEVKNSENENPIYQKWVILRAEELIK
jgi:hypothetical protein